MKVDSAVEVLVNHIVPNAGGYKSMILTNGQFILGGSDLDHNSG